MIRAFLSALFSPSIEVMRAERDLLRFECGVLRANCDEKDRMLFDAYDKIQKLGRITGLSVDRYEAAEAQLAELRSRVEAMALVYPWAAVEERNLPQ